MSKQTIGIGTAANDGTGDPLRTAFNKSNLNFTELYTGLGGVLGKSGAAAALTGSTSETALATVTIPANTIGANGLIRVSSLWTMTTSANNKTPRIRLGGIGGTVIFSTVATTIATFRLETLLIAANATNAQNTQSLSARGTDLLITSSGNTASAVDMTASQDLVISGQLANSGETMTLLGYVVEYAA